MNIENNTLYRESIEDECSQFLDNILNNYALTYITLDDDTRIDISKAILETVISKCKDYGVDTSEAFPYVDENY